MPSTSSASDVSPYLLRVPAAAGFLGVSTAILNKWRCQGEGPPYIRQGRMIAYRIEDLKAWANAGRVDPRQPKSPGE